MALQGRVPIPQSGKSPRGRCLLGADSGRAAGLIRMARAGFRPLWAHRHLGPPAPVALRPPARSPSQGPATLRPPGPVARSGGRPRCVRRHPGPVPNEQSTPSSWEDMWAQTLESLVSQKGSCQAGIRSAPRHMTEGSSPRPAYLGSEMKILTRDNEKPVAGKGACRPLLSSCLGYTPRGSTLGSQPGALVVW